MANFEYGISSNTGTTGDDIFRITYGITNSGWIDGGNGYDIFTISESKNDWSFSDNGQIYFLATEKNAVYGGKQEFTIALYNIEEVQFIDAVFDVSGNLSSTTSNVNTGAGNSSTAQQTNVINTVVDASNTVIGGGSINATYNDLVNINVGSNSSNTIGSNNGGNQSSDNDSAEFPFNEIYGGRKSDSLIGSRKADYLWGGKGNDSLYGNGGDDIIVGGKGIDYLEGGEGSDTFAISKKLGKGRKSYDRIVDFEIGIDKIHISGRIKGMRIEAFKGANRVMSGKNDIIALIDGAAGQLNWSDDGKFIF